MCTIRQGGTRLPGRQPNTSPGSFTKYASTDFPGQQGNIWFVLLACCLLVCFVLACCLLAFLIIGGWDCKLLNNLQIPTVNNLNNLQISIVKIHVCCAGIGETVATLFL
jgi:hypothetical protein